MRLRVDQAGIILGTQEIETTDRALQEFSTMVYEEAAHTERLLYTLPEADRVGEVRLDAEEATFVIDALRDVVNENNLTASQLLAETHQEKWYPLTRAEADIYRENLRDAASELVSYYEAIERLSRAMLDTLHGSEQIAQIRRSRVL